MSSKDAQTVTVTTEPGSVVLGDTVNAVVTIAGEPDHKTRAAKAQLIRTALHRYTVMNVTDHGSHDRLDLEDVVMAEVPLSVAGAHVTPGRFPVSFQIPEDGLPSAKDQVTWSVRAVIDRHFGTDVKADAPVEVRAGPDRFAGEAAIEVRYVDERGIELELSSRSLRPGDTVSGTVVLQPAQAVSVTKVLVLFVVTLPTKKGLEGNAVAPHVLVDEPFDLQSGETREFPFELKLPDDAVPTVRGSLTTPICHAMASWDVGAEAKAVPAADGKKEHKSFVYLGINVYNAPSPTP